MRRGHHWNHRPGCGTKSSRLFAARNKHDLGIAIAIAAIIKAFLGVLVAAAVAASSSSSACPCGCASASATASVCVASIIVSLKRMVQLLVQLLRILAALDRVDAISAVRRPPIRKPNATPRAVEVVAIDARHQIVDFGRQRLLGVVHKIVLEKQCLLEAQKGAYASAASGAALQNGMWWGWASGRVQPSENGSSGIRACVRRRVFLLLQESPMWVRGK
jgi:hypothetical protein